MAICVQHVAVVSIPVTGSAAVVPFQQPAADLCLYATILSLSVLQCSLADFFEGSTDADSTIVCAAACVLMICTGMLS